MASLGGTGESVVVRASELGSATATLLAGARVSVVPVDRTPQALDELPEGIGREVGNTTDQAVARTLIDPAAGLAAYSRRTAALSHLVRILDLELRPHGIRVTAVAPQLLDTSRNRAGLPSGGAGIHRPAGSGC